MQRDHYPVLPILYWDVAHDSIKNLLFCKVETKTSIKEHKISISAVDVKLLNSTLLGNQLRLSQEDFPSGFSFLFHFFQT